MNEWITTSEVVSESEAIRRHEEQLARIETSNKTRLANIEQENLTRRRAMITFFLLWLGIIIIIAIFAGCSIASSKDCAKVGGYRDPVSGTCEKVE